MIKLVGFVAIAHLEFHKCACTLFAAGTLFAIPVVTAIVLSLGYGISPNKHELQHIINYNYLGTQRTYTSATFFPESCGDLGHRMFCLHPGNLWQIDKP